MGKKTRKHRGGGGGGTPYSSASTWGNYINGSANSQYDRVFMNSKTDSNAIIGKQGQHAGATRRRRHRHRRHYGGNGSCSGYNMTKKGGFIGSLNRAIAPLLLLGAQMFYKKKYRNTSKH